MAYCAWEQDSGMGNFPEITMTCFASEHVYHDGIQEASSSLRVNFERLSGTI